MLVAVIPRRTPSYATRKTCPSPKASRLAFTSRSSPTSPTTGSTPPFVAIRITRSARSAPRLTSTATPGSTHQPRPLGGIEVAIRTIEKESWRCYGMLRTDRGTARRSPHMLNRRADLPAEFDLWQRPSRCAQAEHSGQRLYRHLGCEQLAAARHVGEPLDEFHQLGRRRLLIDHDSVLPFAVFQK